MSNLERLRGITYESRSDNLYAMEPISFAQARLGGDFSCKSVIDLIAEAESLNKSEFSPMNGQFGRMRWFLECALKNDEPRQVTDILLLLSKYWLEMNDWPRVLRCVETGTLPADSGDERVARLQVNLAAAFVIANLGSASLTCLRPLYHQMPTSVQPAAREVIWSALKSPELIGEDNYLWALRILFESAVARQDANLMLHDLHILARVMEPIGRKEMGTWLRHTLRAEAPGYWFGDRHDRLNYYGSPQLTASFERGIRQMCEEFKPIICGQLAALLRSQPAVGSPGSPKLES
jgi:hypothetical protein